MEQTNADGTLDDANRMLDDANRESENARGSLAAASAIDTLAVG